MSLPFALQGILRQKKNYENSKYFTMQKYNLQKIPSERNQNASTYYDSRTQISSFNTSQNIIFQKSSYKNRPIN